MRWKRKFDSGDKAHLASEYKRTCAGEKIVHQIHINDQLYLEAQRRATEAGFSSVDDYVADVLQHNLQQDTENFDYLFTPERVARIDRAAAQIDADLGVPAEQMREHFRQKRDA